MNDYLRHEALDRTNLICNIIGQNLLEHPYVLNSKELNGMVYRALVLLETVYQQIGEEHLNEPRHTGN
jgi:hypothetical protein